MPVCASCHDAIRDIYPKAREIYGKAETTTTYPAYNAASNQGCWICVKHAEFLEQYYPQVYQLWLKDPLIVTFRSRYVYGEGLQNTIPNQTPSGEPFPVESRGHRNLELQQLMFTRKHAGSNEEGCLIELRLYRDEEVPEARLYVQGSTLGAIDIRQIQDWIKNCDGLHTHCHPYPDTPWYPTRLLDLSQGGDTINLFVSEETKPVGSYMTLSHRWACYQYEKLTSQSLGRFKSSISVQSLPLVFQEAISVTRLLGIRYLWIDSLCIMQDKACGDWEVEALRMGQVYANTYLNLSASYADEEEENPPIFTPKCWNDYLPSVLDLDDEIELRRNVFVDGFLWTDEVHESPLMARGWVFQERFLAPRVLHFGMRQLAWECNEGAALEMFPSGLPPGFEDVWKRHICCLWSMRQAHSDEFCHRWHSIVAGYSACSLTFHTDKLIAVAGIAQLIQSLRGDEYIAGMWKSTLRENLAWWSLETNERSSSGGEVARLAPSWSWLSLDGEVDFYPQPSAHDKPEYFCRVLEAPGRDSAGASVLTARGILKLQGMVLPVESLEWLEDTIRFFEVDGVRVETDPATAGPESTKLDYDGSRADIDSLCSQQQLALLPLYATGRFVIGILISKLYTNPAWRRVGAASIEYAKIPAKREGPHPDGWMFIPETNWMVHIGAYSLYDRISKAFKAGKTTTLELV